MIVGLVIFQNKDTSYPVAENEMTEANNYSRQRQFKKPLPCQMLEESGLIRGTGVIPGGFTLTPFSCNENLTKEVGDEYFLWCRIRDNS